MDIQRQLEINETRHYRADDRYLAKMDKAEAMVGELCREGKQVYYIFPVGGRYREGERYELIDFLIRNRYVGVC